jgi:8-oxo-dGTP pyrophosphatase MutT (NUDIX family)
MSERRRGPAEAPNFGEPATPRPAASVVLVRNGPRHGDEGLEVLLLKRTEKARFMPGVWVFPGGAVDGSDGEGEESHRACALRELAEEAAVELDDARELVLFSRWITPEVISTRFDARFYLAAAPSHCRARPDGVEVLDAVWFKPADALAGLAAGEIAIAFPTARQLESLAEFASAEEAIQTFRGRRVEPILPKVIGSPEEHRVVLPGDPDYPG